MLYFFSRLGLASAHYFHALSIAEPLPGMEFDMMGVIYPEEIHAVAPGDMIVSPTTTCRHLVDPSLAGYFIYCETR